MRYSLKNQMRLPDSARPATSASGFTAVCSANHKQYAAVQAVPGSLLQQSPAAVFPHVGQRQDQQHQAHSGTWQPLIAATEHQPNTWAHVSVDLAQHQQPRCLQHGLLPNLAGSSSISSSKWHTLQPLQPLPVTQPMHRHSAPPGNSSHDQQYSTANSRSSSSSVWSQESAQLPPLPPPASATAGGPPSAAELGPLRCRRLAEVLLRCGKASEAAHWADQALACNPWDVELLLLRGRCLEAAGNVPGEHTWRLHSILCTSAVFWL